MFQSCRTTNFDACSCDNTTIAVLSAICNFTGVRPCKASIYALASMHGILSQERIIKWGGGRACNFRRFWTGQNNPPVLFIEHSFARKILIAWQDPVCARIRHILATTGRFGCASSVAVSEVLQGQQQVPKEKQITTVIACSEMLFATEGPHSSA